ncbi:unnamed protein product [Brugia pahangi]|uniref:G_PROTEIN_RECEP_F1_2 domain-containing protein n=1 Tax=Brugia pahangi TaxID=6280 RepID=A0A0N4T1X3_BRUPA|nr:unnamed protein product [Brugia pahangi]
MEQFSLRLLTEFVVSLLSKCNSTINPLIILLSAKSTTITLIQIVAFGYGRYFVHMAIVALGHDGYLIRSPVISSHNVWQKRDEAAKQSNSDKKFFQCPIINSTLCCSDTFAYIK